MPCQKKVFSQPQDLWSKHIKFLTVFLDLELEANWQKLLVVEAITRNQIPLFVSSTCEKLQILLNVSWRDVAGDESKDTTDLINVSNRYSLEDSILTRYSTIASYCSLKIPAWWLASWNKTTKCRLPISIHYCIK